MKRVEKGITPISALFSKHQAMLKAPQSTVIRTTQEVIHDMIGTIVPGDRIRYSAGSRTVSLHCGGPLKSEILLHKKDILVHLKGRLGNGSPKDLV